MRYIVVPAVWALFGLFLVVASLYTVPYNVREQFRVDREKTWIDEAFILGPSMDRDFILDSIVQNVSIFQIDVISSDFVTFRIVAYNTGRVWLEREARWDSTSYWTPPLSGGGIWRFVFHNPSTATVNVTVKVTEYYLKVRDYQTIVQYRAVLDTTYGYLGLGLIAAAVVFNAAYISRLESRNKKSET